MDLIWHIPSESMYDRIEELREYLERFPNGAMAGPLEKELEYLEAMSDCRFEEAKRLTHRRPRRAGRRQRGAGIQRMRPGWSRLREGARARLL